MKIAKVLMGVAIAASLGLTEGKNTIDVDAQIEAIQNASPEKRYELMNEFKGGWGLVMKINF